MNPEEVSISLVTLRTVVKETVEECSKQRPQRMEFSKKLIIGASIFYALMGIACLVLWVLLGEWPYEIAIFFVSPILGIASYMIKSGYENKAKIEKGKKEA